MTKSDATIRIEYADLLAGEEDQPTLDLIRGLETRFQPGDPWEELPAVPLAGQLHACQPPASRRPDRRRRGFRRLTPAGAILAVALLGVSIVLAASGILNLGAPTNDVAGNPYTPLSGFHRIGTVLRAHLRPELLMITAQNDSWTGAEAWALVKALDQFGTFSQVSATTVPAPIVYQAETSNSNPLTKIREPEPTFDLSHAVYRSRYLVFVHKYVLDAKNQVYQRLNAAEQRLYARYARSALPDGSHDPDNFLGTLNNKDPRTNHRFPLIAAGGYLQTESNILFPLDFLIAGPGSNPQQQTLPHYATFDEVQGSLATGKPATGIEHSLISNINAEANVITALICHADGSQPRSVCGRHVIKSILRHVH
jgi:hypothetical protein